MGIETLKYDRLHRAKWLCHTYLVATAFANRAHDFRKMTTWLKGSVRSVFLRRWGHLRKCKMLFRLTDFGCFWREIYQRLHCQQTLPSPSIHLGRVSQIGSWMLCVPCTSRLRFTILTLEWPHWRHHTAHALSKTSGNFSKTFDDWNTATQCLDLFTSIWMSYFKSKLLF